MPGKNAALAVVRDAGNNPQSKAARVMLPPTKPVEPNWGERLPILADGDPDIESQTVRARKVASEAWRRWSKQLSKAGLYNEVHADVLADAAVCVARLDQCERDIAQHGIQYFSDRHVKVLNRSVSAATQYRASLKAYIVQLGLAPNAKLKPRDDVSAGDDVWDE